MRLLAVAEPEKDLAEMPGRPGWATLQALKAGRSCGFDEARYAMLVRPGPRLAQGAQLIARCLQAHPA